MRETLGLDSCFTVIERDGVKAYVRSEDARWLEDAGVLTPDSLCAAGELARGRGQAVELAGRRLFLKRYFRGGARACLLGGRYLGLGRFRRELAAYERAAACGLIVPRVEALVARRCGLGWRVWLLTGYLENIRPLRHVLAEAGPGRRARLLAATGRALRGLHAAGVIHPDLTLDNVSIGPEDAPVLLDFDRCVFSRCAARRWHGIFRLHRSALKRGLWRGPRGARRERCDAAAFLVGYFEGAGRGARAGCAVAAAFRCYRAVEWLHSLSWSGHEA